jgi:hypothetical protein
MTKQVMKVRIYGAIGADEKIHLFQAFFTESKYVIVYDCDEDSYMNERSEVVTQISMIEKDSFESILGDFCAVIPISEKSQEILPTGGFSPEEIVSSISPENYDEIVNEIVDGEGFQEWTNLVCEFFSGVRSGRGLAQTLPQ